ncbi:MAG: CoA-acylating methylmalonate-semialdehyde dehydrogenase [Planctomycetota bacterium]|jgi:malonate-semialdehyde dehydrogenase (acetylating)/methylmalonate-semialdehyde dehydrogenase
MSNEVLQHLIAGKPHDDPGTTQRTNIDPATGETVSIAPLDAVAAADAAVAAARAAFGPWSQTPVGDRIQHLFRYKAILEEHADELAAGLVKEHGKTHAESVGSVRRGIDCIEHACAAPVLTMGRTLPQIAVSSSFCRTEDEGGVGIDSSADRVPLGVCVGITPFNFPVMVPMWMWPMAVACGNTFVLKPSEKDPISAIRTTELAHEAGFPPGVINLVHGGAPVVNRLIEHDDVAAVSFVGSTRAGAAIYANAAAHGKRVQCMAGAKNFSIIMPDANRGAAVDGIFGSAFGNTGQRCLAGSVVVCVGDAGEWFVPALVERTRALKVGAGDAPGTEMGPLQDPESKARVLDYIGIGEAEGADLLIDGRSAEVPAAGCFVGPTILDRVTPSMRVAQEEIFGPVLSVMHAGSLEEAIGFVNASEYGNMSVIFTDSGHAVRKFERTVEAGMLGVNVGVPAPMAAFPFSGWKKSFFGDLHANGEDGARFFTKSRVMVRRWI